MNCIAPMCLTSLTRRARLSIPFVEFMLEEHHA
jgi:hypothetical protein